MQTLRIDRRLDRPVYEQIADQLRRAIAAGDLRSGTTVPSVRQLAGDLGVNLNTVARAYRLLEGEGFLAIRHRAGVVVAAPAARVPAAVRAELVEQLRVALARLRQAGMTDGELMRVARREVVALAGGKESRTDE